MYNKMMTGLKIKKNQILSESLQAFFSIDQQTM